MNDHSNENPVIGVLALQGAVERHVQTLERCAVTVAQIRFADELDAIDGLIIPGGESTTVGKLMDRYGIDKKIIRRANAGMPIFGTCTGMILLAKGIEGSDQHRLGLMDCTVRRNAFGRQAESFETDLDIEVIGAPPVRAIFIRAPYVTELAGNVRILAQYRDKAVLLQQANLLAGAFHPELTDDTRVHEYFIRMVRSHMDTRNPNSTERWE